MKKGVLKLLLMGISYVFIGFLFQLLFINLLWATETKAQEIKDIKDVFVSVEIQDKTLGETFKMLEGLTPFKFVYDKKDSFLKDRFNLERRTVSIEDILIKIATDSRLSFKQINNNITVSKRIENQEGAIEIIDISVEVTGTVTDQNGEPIPGVTVSVAGTTVGTATDLDGRYALSVPDGSTLVFSFIGFETQSIVVGGRSIINVVLSEDMASLDEVVVVGYGTVERKDLTGSISSVSEKELQSRPVPSFQESIMGKSPGVLVRQSGGDLDGKYSITIRGVGSVTGDSDPLIVVDGVPLFSAGFSTINPKDIVSVDILKDASATAIYGARAANGVVIVSTRRGQPGKPQLTFSIDQGFEKIASNYSVMSTEQQRQLFVEAFKNSERSTAVYDDPVAPVWQIDTDWQDLATRTAHRQNYNLGVRGGSDKTHYAASLAYLKREGTFINSDIESWSLRTNVDAKISDRLTIVTNLASSYQRQNVLPTDEWQGGYRSLFEQHSYTEPFDENGDLYAVNTTAAPYFGSNNNPLIDLWLPTRESSQTRILGNAKIDLEIIDGVTLSGNLGGDILLSEGYNYLPVYEIGIFARDEGSVSESTNRQINWVSDITLSYNKIFSKHNFNVLAGASAQQFFIRNTNITGTGTVNNFLNQLSNQTNYNASGSEVTAGLLSNFLRLNYSFNSKYLFTGTIRRDGSSKFGPSSRYGTFPSASVALSIPQ